MKKILILCTGNSCRSQMADGILKENLPNSFLIKSAGTKPEPVNKYAIEVMNLININISKNESNHINDFDNILFDYVITVCDNALEICPVFNNAKKHIHKSFRDPAKFKGNLKDTINFYSEIRDEISLFFNKLIKEVILKEESC